MQRDASNPSRQLHREMHTLELIIHLSVVAAAALQFAWRGYRWSAQFEQGGPWDGYAPGLQPGRLLGRRVDLSDIQWREFRAGMLPLSLVLAAFAGLLRLAQRSSAGSSQQACAQRQQQLILAASLCFLGYLHGACALFVVCLVLAYYLLARAVAGMQYGAAVIWSANVGALLAARVWEGFRFASLAPALAVLDSHRGAMRWEICFNLTVLRMLSFALDLQWRQRQLRQLRQQQQGAAGITGNNGSTGGSTGGGGSGTPSPAVTAEAGSATNNMQQLQGVQKQMQKQGNVGQQQVSGEQGLARCRQRTPLPELSEYNALACLAYCLFPPLYLAGPIITFQDFAWQLRQRQPPTMRQVVRYAALFAADWLCLELLTRTLYFNSVAKYRIGLRYRQHGLQYGTMEIGMTGFWVLCFMWLKFATIWRFFRLASLLAGISPPENMRRCFANNYDVEGFWKGWHASYNQWLVRYLYVPLGGSAWRLFNIWPIFLFVAVWHDLEWRLIGWAWLVCLAFVPELLAKRLAASPRWDSWRQGAAFRHVCAAAAALNITGLMAANLAGFVLGLDGLSAFITELLRDPGFLATALAVFYCAAQCMFWLRAREERVGHI